MSQLANQRPPAQKQPRLKMPKYLAWVSTLECCVCGHYSVPHHLIGKGDGATGSKASDILAMPLCNKHHTGRDGIHALTVEYWENVYGSQRMHVLRTIEQAVRDGVLK